MSKLFIVLLLAALMIPAGVFAAPQDLSCTGCGGSNATWTGTGYGMMRSGADGYSCGNGTACDAADCSCGMMGDNGRARIGTNAGSCGMIGNDPVYPGTGYNGMMGNDPGYPSSNNYGMMGGYYGMGPGGGAGMYGWMLGGVIIFAILILIWIVAGILLILLLYRKLSVK